MVPRDPWTRRGLLALVVAISAAVFDCFGAQSKTDELSLEVWTRLTGPYYARSAQDRITVVLSDDAFVARADQSWPISYATHAETLERIAAFEPRAVFLDFLFLHEHLGDETLPILVETLRRLRTANLPIFVAAPNPCLTNAFDDSTAWKEVAPGLGVLPDIADNATPVPVEWIAYDDLTYPLAFEPRALADAFPAARRCAAVDAPNGPWRSAALALFETTCMAGPPSPACAEWPTSRELPDDMFVRWGAGASRAQTSPGQDCLHLDFSPLDRLGWVARVLGADLVRKVARREPKYLTCSYADTVSLSQLFRRDPVTGIDWRPDEDEQRLRDLLRDRAVLFGDGLDYSRDKVVSPVHGKLPGVYQHAMALDNLLVYGPDYYRRSEWLEVAIEIGLSVLAIWVATWVGRRHERLYLTRASGTGVARWIASAVAVYLAIVAAFVAIVLTTAGALNLSPVNWVGVLSVFSIVVPFYAFGPAVAAYQNRRRASEERLEVPYDEPSENIDEERQLPRTQTGGR